MLWLGWLLDRLLGDPERLPHLIVGFGKVISWTEGKYNHGEHRRRNGAMVALSLILAVALLSFSFLDLFLAIVAFCGGGGYFGLLLPSWDHVNRGGRGGVSTACHLTSLLVESNSLAS